MGGDAGLIYDALQKAQPWQVHAYLFYLVGIFLFFLIIIFVIYAYSLKKTKKNRLVKTSATWLAWTLVGFLIYSALYYGNRVGFGKVLLVYVTIPLVVFLVIGGIIWLASFLAFPGYKTDKGFRKDINFIVIFSSLVCSTVMVWLIIGLRVLG